MSNDVSNSETPNDSTKRSALDNILDILLCRGDVSEDVLEKEPVPLQDLFRFSTTKDVIFIVLGSIFACFGGIVQPFVFILGGRITTVFLEKGEKIGNETFLGDVKFYIIWMVVSGICSFLFTYLQGQFLNLGCTSIVSRIRYKFLGAVLRQDAEWFDATNSGTITTQLNENIDRIEDGLGDKIGLLLRGYSMFISSIGVCVVINWRLTIITLTMGPLGAMILAVMGKAVSGYSAQMLQTSAKSGVIAEEAIMNVKTVAACNAQDHMVKKYSKVLEDGKKPAIRYHFWVGFFEGLTFMEIYIVMAAALGYGIYGFYNGSVSKAGDVLLVVNTVSLTAYYLGLLGPHMMAIVKARVAAAVIYETIDRKVTKLTKEQIEHPTAELKGEIRFENVHFAYPTRKLQPVLKGISWEAKAGESIGLVGSSGCGKSTSIGLITKLYEASQGSITIDDIPIEKYDTKRLRQNIGIVQQEPCLFNGTIMENICLGRKNVTPDRAKIAAQMAEASVFIEKLQSGYNTLIGAGGVSLSGGQKQRIAIARAIATDPRILLLDEATSALDTESERIVQAALHKASAGRTTIIIAHRISTLKDVNRIYVMKEGQIVETGLHEELLQSEGLYSTLARAQEILPSIQPHFTKTEHVPHRKNSNVLPDHTFSRSLSMRESSRTKRTNEKTDAVNQSTPKASGLFLMYRNLASDRLKFILSILISFIRGLEMPLLGLVFFLAFQALQQTSDTYGKYAWLTIGACLLCGVVVWCAQSTQYMLSGWTAECVIDRLRVRVLRSLLHRNIHEFDGAGSSPAAAVSILSQHAPNCYAAFDYRFVLNTGNFFSVLSGLVLSLIFSWKIGLLGTGLCFLLYLLTFANIRLTHIARAKKEKEDRSSEFAIEMVEQAKTIQLLTVEEHFLATFERQQQNSTKYDRLIGFVDSANFAATQGFVFLCDLSCYALAAYLMYKGDGSVQKIFLAFVCAQFSGWSVMYSAPYIPELLRAAASAQQLFTLIDEEEKINISITAGSKPEISGDLSVENVSFAYPTRPNSLVAKNLNFKVTPGQRIALVGSSGCGKSTIINLLERFYEPNSGNIKLNSNKIDSINLKYLREKVTLVGQEPVLFKGSIVENITMGAGAVTMEDVRNSCNVANAAKFIEAFPLGYETDVGENGSKLSGGQKQRIAIARALIRNPKILLLDEATSALDTQSEEIVQQALNDASAGRTSITIAHRLSSIQNCDRIYLIEKGSVLEEGTHFELIDLNGKYAKLVHAQQLSRSDR